ncbi:hypothetical protein P256_00050 [Acinetobacter nectaris CIP 110549]|uniref:Uncharacterized protein n=1 Tax=Acinetobacter nectaris CIP 110549 TaxID=1392540 RepID=V2TZ26_9GAMM|nr:hypothetical protein [Acinetobacter nectaris]ESK41065.1 hypothetical protein P256_00050 [Acinetobacter nectaris CIP 110549]
MTNLEQQPQTAQPTTEQSTESTITTIATEAEGVIKKGVEDLEKAYSFIQHGVDLLGPDAKSELLTLAIKFL